MAASTPPRRRLLLGTSLKMYFDLPKTQSYITSLSGLTSLATTNNVDLFVIPDFVSLAPSAALLSRSPISLGAQDCHSQISGAHTGSISPLNLRQAGVKIVEIGHAERRRDYGETDADVAAKAAAVVSQGMTPLVCVGETQTGNIASAAVGAAVEEIRPQIAAVLKAIPQEAEVVFAYEPVWAIGKSEPAGKDHVVAVARELRRMTEGRSGQVRILYGGSAGPGTWQGIKEGVDGMFLGRFAHDVKNVEKVIQEMAQ
ncbi:Triosephosphate isomerase [Myriangium duriaei CBS 260.36]|uniref:Triosephosphate isomerase n=1 Tax=Myriangium duriaei CBS 260.36 TaxID=1168546 RepID=A0A9P4MDM6_9PEZI|nr:Triosephosphate isomerase [Myriangium duriaei CBS 260.36]